ncbi:enoyl-CoA hydratase/isomerase family protein [Burkholderia guangdongensis]|uniref:enoyl-CoA hydratase/isomerase family protein n=1 Tax=Burkholderia guangdongensis TaxID=1792500 RepID=UPI0015C8F927|nr:enoyl-CoA hydratase/isomerase family protein [Burkholderia guangdongensis]
MKSIRFERDGKVGSIVLANPPYNRLDLRFAQCLQEAVHEASESDIRVLVIRAEGPNFSLGGEVREWPGKDLNWFRTFVAHVNTSYRAIEALRVPTVAVVQGLAIGGGFELALACDFIVVASDAMFCNVEVTTAMLPIAGGLQRLAERVGRSRASRFAMLGEMIPGSVAGDLGIATHVADPDSLERVAGELVARLADGPTLSYAATRTLLKTWSSGGVAGADIAMLDITMPLYLTEDATRGFANTCEAFDRDEVPADMIFHGK